MPTNTYLAHNADSNPILNLLHNINELLVSNLLRKHEYVSAPVVERTMFTISIVYRKYLERHGTVLCDA